MKATISLIMNSKEIEKAEELNLKIPDTEYHKTPMYFDVDKVDYAYLNPDNEIIININGVRFACVYEKELWENLIKNKE